jgi:hypothetical protein
MKLPYFGLNVRLLFTDLFRIRIHNVYFGSGSDPDKSFGSFRIRFRFRIRIRNTAIWAAKKYGIQKKLFGIKKNSKNSKKEFKLN